MVTDPIYARESRVNKIFPQICWLIRKRLTHEQIERKLNDDGRIALQPRKQSTLRREVLISACSRNMQ
jgi:hypothetical protein